MLRIWRVFWHEYWGHLTRKSYLIFTFGFPFFMLAAPVVGGIVLAVAIQNALPEMDPRPVGVVDQAALFSPDETPAHAPVAVRRYSSPRAAQQALAAGEIQAIYDIQPDYWQTGVVVMHYDTADCFHCGAGFSGYCVWLSLNTSS